MKIVVLSGGISTERDVSFSTGSMVYAALKKKGHQVVLLDVYLGYEGPYANHVFELDYAWDKDIQDIKDSTPDIEEVKVLRKDKENGFFGPNVIDICRQSDIVFMGLHGENGENGKIQAAFDLLNIKYTGTDYVSSALAMDKALSKELFLQNNVSTPKSFFVTKEEENESPIGYPCVVKTTCGGSSVGVYMVHDTKEYQSAVKSARLYGREMIAESYIKGREFSVGVIEGKALPIVEIQPKVGFYDYKNKYQAGNTIETCPAELSDEITSKMQKSAEHVFRVLRLKTYARMDYLLDDQGQFYCLEANTLPGMTKTSLVPQEAAAMGISFEDLCEWLIEVSMRKYEC